MPSQGRTPFANLPQWVLTEKPAMNDFNEAFANTDAALAGLDAQKMSGINLLGGTANLYVRPTGNDSSNGSNTAPFQTLGRAVKEAARYVNGNVVIRLANGTYTESEQVALHYYGTIVSIMAEDNDNPAVTLKVPRILVRGSKLYTSNIRFAGTNSEYHVIHGQYRALVYVMDCTITGAGGASNGFHMDDSSGRIVRSTVNHCNIAVSSTGDASVYASANTGTGNATAFQSNASRIVNIGTYPSATTKIRTPNNGQILGVD